MARIKNYDEYLAVCDAKSQNLDSVIDTANDKLDDLNARLKNLRTSVKDVADSISEDLDITNPEEFAWFDRISDAQAEKCYDAWDKVAELSSQCSELIRHINYVLDQLDGTEI